jgi:hypothetical protein
MRNLLQETLAHLDECQLTPQDVLWVGTANQWFTWDEFALIANIAYDGGYGAQQIANDLVVVGQDWYLDRDEYDGAEGWELRRVPTRPPLHRVPAFVACSQVDHLVGWRDLATINTPPTMEELEWIAQYNTVAGKKGKDLTQKS